MYSNIYSGYFKMYFTRVCPRVSDIFDKKIKKKEKEAISEKKKKRASQKLCRSVPSLHTSTQDDV